VAVAVAATGAVGEIVINLATSPGVIRREKEKPTPVRRALQLVLRPGKRVRSPVFL
jgi:hypothetical protein